MGARRYGECLLCAYGAPLRLYRRTTTRVLSLSLRNWRPPPTHRSRVSLASCAQRISQLVFLRARVEQFFALGHERGAYFWTPFAFFAGWAVGSMVAAHYLDRSGRKRVLLASMFGGVVSWLLTATCYGSAIGYATFLCLQAAVGGCTGGVIGSAYLLVIESTPAHLRSRVTVVM